MFSTIYAKGNNFRGFLFASLDDVLQNRSSLTLVHSGRPKLNRVLAILSAIGLKGKNFPRGANSSFKS